MLLVPFDPAHVKAMSPQSAQLGEVQMQALTGEFGKAWTVMDVDRQIIGCGGVVDFWPGRGYAWALLSDQANRHLLSLTRLVRAYLDSLPHRRIEMTVDAGFCDGCRWALILGFSLETPVPMRAFFPNGHDGFLYSRVK